MRREYRNGGRRPGEVSLSRTLGISRNTLRAAILRLVAEGRLERKAGVGTRVTEPKIKSGVGAWHSFTREMEGQGITVETSGLTPEQIEKVRGGGWNLPLLQQTVDQFVLHFDVAGTSRRCFQVLQDDRGLSVHFMLDVIMQIF